MTNEIRISKEFDWHSEDLMYDVVATVLKLQGTIKINHIWAKLYDANYNQVHKELCKTRRVSIMDVIRYLRLAEELGYIRGHGGYWNHHGRGGAKRWHFVKWPPYPYYELMGGNNGE